MQILQILNKWCICFSWFLRWLGISFIHFEIDAHKEMFINALQPLTNISMWVKNKGAEFPSLITRFADARNFQGCAWKAHFLRYIDNMLRS